SELSSQEIRRLFRALVETLHEAVKHRGTTIDEYPFVDLYGNPGDYQHELKVFAQDGEPCRRCRATISKLRFANKPLYLCESCQVRPGPDVSPPRPPLPVGVAGPPSGRGPPRLRGRPGPGRWRPPVGSARPARPGPPAPPRPRSGRDGWSP